MIAELVLFKVLSLFKNLLINLIAVSGGIAILCQQHDQVNLKFSFDLGAIALADDSKATKLV